MFTTTNKKFLNIDAPEQPSAPTSVAAIMATKGVITTPDSTVEVPSINTEKQEETTTAQEPAPVETTNEASNGDTVNQESQKPPTEPVQETTLQVEETPKTVVPTWQEVLKQQQPDVIIKELGYDVGAVALAKEIQENKQMLAFYEHWKSNGDVQAYLKELTTDYNKMAAEEVMRHQLRAEYPKASEQQLDILYRKKVVEAYKLNPDLFDESEVEEGKMLLEAEAEKYRDTMVAKQQEYLLPKPPEPKSQVEPVEDTGQQELEVFKSLVNDHSLTKSVFANKSIAIGEGEDAFKYPIQNPETVTDLLFDSQKWAENLYDIQKSPSGEVKYIPNVEKQLLVATFAKDPKGFIREIAKHYKSLGGKAALDPIENASLPDGSKPSKSEVTYSNPAEALAKKGRLVN
jgi:hypothetical protein